MGLLEMLGSSVDDPKTAATLALAQGLLTGRSGMTGLLGGAQGYIGTMAAAKQQEEARKQEALKMQLLQAQIGETQAQAMQRQAESKKLEEVQRQAQMFQQALAPKAVSPTQAASAPGGPTQANAGMIGARQPMDWAALARQFPGQIDVIKKLAESQDFGRQEVARTIEGEEGGKPVTFQQTKFGEKVGAAIPKAVEMKLANLGGSDMAYNPYALKDGQQFARTQDPNSVASNGLGWARLAFDKSKDAADRANPAGGNFEYKQDANMNWMALPKQPSMDGKPIQPIPVAAPNKNVEGAKKAIAIIDAAGPIIDKSTSSYLGAGLDMGARVFGHATEGAMAGSQLKALEGALMMSQPRMEGPQSDKDVALYRQMAGQIGDPTVPAAQKHAALAEIRKLHERYAGGSTPAVGGWSITPVGR